MAESSFTYLQIPDPRVNFSNRKPVYGLSAANNSAQVTRYPASSWSTSNVTFKLVPPNPTSVLDRVVKMEFELKVDFTGPDSGTPLLKIGTADGVRQFPILACCNSFQVAINNENVSTIPQEWIHRLMRYYSSYEVDTSDTANMPDQYQDYADYVTYGANRNPLGLYGDVTIGSTRTDPYITVTSNTNTAASVLVKIAEIVPVTPFLITGLSHGLQYLNNLNFSIGLTNLSRVWCHASSGNTISTISVSIPNAPVACCNWLSRVEASLDQALLPNPRVYEYQNLLLQSQNYGSVNAGQQVIGQTQVIPFPTIPKRVFIFAKRRLNDETYLTSDVNARIDAVKIVYDNNTAMTQADSRQLYNISVKNGLTDTWPQWSKFTGSVLCLEFGSDIPLTNPDDYPGKVRQNSFSAQVTFTNLSASAINFDLDVVVVYPGLLTIGAMGTSLIQGFDPMFIQNTNDYPAALDYQLSNNPYMLGGGFFDSIKKFLGNVIKNAPAAINKASEIAQVAAPIVSAFNPHLGSQLAMSGMLGQSFAPALQNIVGSGMRNNAMSGSGLIGGKLMGGVGIGGKLMGGAIRRGAGNLEEKNDQEQYYEDQNEQYCDNQNENNTEENYYPTEYEKPKKKKMSNKQLLKKLTGQ